MFLPDNPETYDIDIVNQKEEHCVQRAFLISCANASQYGNNIYIAPQASVRDGLLDVTIIKPFTVLDAPQMALQLLNGTIDDNNHFNIFRCKSLSIHRQHPGVIHFDGDPMPSDSEVEIAIVPNGLNVVCPNEEGVLDMAENIQTVIMERFRTVQMCSEELIRVNRRTNRKLREQTQKLMNKIIVKNK